MLNIKKMSSPRGCRGCGVGSLADGTGRDILGYRCGGVDLAQSRRRREPRHGPADHQSSRPSSAPPHCFYVNGNPRCDNTGAVCDSFADCAEGDVFGSCVPGWVEVNFDIILTPTSRWHGAPAAVSRITAARLATVWPRASPPCPGGIFDHCIPTATNAGTRVPPVGEEPFVGELKVHRVDRTTRLPAGAPAPRAANDLEGAGTITKVGFGRIDTQKYNAIGLRTTDINDGDNVLVIGGGVDTAEYQPCPAGVDLQSPVRFRHRSDLRTLASALRAEPGALYAGSAHSGDPARNRAVPRLQRVRAETVDEPLG